ncbi:hypothetical protein ABBQ32_002365 [Trebouxia sp. C0010 RCD-2024]
MVCTCVLQSLQPSGGGPERCLARACTYLQHAPMGRPCSSTLICAAPGASFRTEAAARVDVASTATSQLGMCLRDQDVHSPISIFANKGCACVWQAALKDVSAAKWTTASAWQQP